MTKLKYLLIVSFSLGVDKTSFCQQEVLSDACEIVAKKDTASKAEKNSLIRSIIEKEEPGCIYRDEQSGFSEKVSRLAIITSLDEKVKLFDGTSANLKLYLFPYILHQNDSIGFELLTRAIHDSAEVAALCSCIVNDEPINVRLAHFYFGFIQLKYYWGTSGTVNRIAFPAYYARGKKPGKKIWKQKLSQFKSIVEIAIPGFEKSLFPYQLKEWNKSLSL